MPFTIERNDMARMRVDAVVVTANEGLQINGGVGLSVGRAAGLELLQEACDELGGCPTGEAVATPGFALAADHIVHVVGPVWQGGTHGEEAILRQAYDNALACAYDVGARSIALPLISAHTFGFPVRTSFVIAVQASRAFLENHDVDIHLVLYGEDAMAVGVSMYDNIAEYIDDHYIQKVELEHRSAQRASNAGEPSLQGPRFSKPARKPRGHRIIGGLSGIAEGIRELAENIRATDKPKPSHGTCVVRSDEELAELDALNGPFVTAEHMHGIQESTRPGFCPRCGERVEGMTFCPRCGSFLPKDEIEKSGSRVDAAASVMDYEAAAAPQPIDAAMPLSSASQSASEAFAPPMAGDSLAEWLDQLDAPFSTTLLALIDARGMNDVEVYKRANMSRQLFSKIRSDATYRPAKKTVLALAIALGLNLVETIDLLQRAGFALSHSSKSDVIVEYFIVNGKHDIYEVNEALYAFDQPLL